jgi:hypothetical protein
MTHTAPHPAPHRHRAPLAGQVFGLVAGPVAWGVQLVAGYGLSGHACFPGDHPVARIALGWGWMRAACLGLNLLALGVCVAAGLYSLSLWRATQHEAQGRARTVVDVGEGRTRFSSLCGALTSAGFALAILFNTVVILGAPACRG